VSPGGYAGRHRGTRTALARLVEALDALERFARGILRVVPSAACALDLPLVETFERHVAVFDESRVRHVLASAAEVARSIAPAFFASQRQHRAQVAVSQRAMSQNRFAVMHGAARVRMLGRVMSSSNEPGSQHAAEDDGRTRFSPARPAATAPEPGDDKTRLRAPGSQDEKTRLVVSAAPATDRSQWTDAGAAADGPAADVGPGTVLKGRFVLEDVVGRGGMGVVFRARDLRQEEAQDRDPFVAIKVLNDEFRRHPESLRALQREARKAQTLAHPNIATVFDFDRDGATVYIQMEFLDGERLDKLAGRLGGLPYAKAYPLIAEMGRALSYAHGRGIVHSDFKPNNCFLTKLDVIKVFDFGIARAAKIPGARAGTNEDLTRFDAGMFGALTPAYASLEMLEGEEPDPRDDIYALGCVAYELLTGKHPFDRRPATEARDAKLEPRAVKGLTPRQNRALQKAVAFRREERSASVAALLEDLGEHKVNKSLLASGIAATGALIVAGFVLLPSYLNEREVGRIAAELASTVPQRIEAALVDFSALPPASRTEVLQTAREPLLAYYQGLVAAAVDQTQERYDYPRAEAILETAGDLVPDRALFEASAKLASYMAALLLNLRTQVD
jgi:predicted Ser/Thr protein kinase